MIYDEPFLIEYNIRMGDLMSIIPRLKTDIIKIFKGVLANKLKNLNIKWKKKNA